MSANYRQDSDDVINIRYECSECKIYYEDIVHRNKLALFS